MWDMPITIEIADTVGRDDVFSSVFTYFAHVDALFNTFDPKSEISRINILHIHRSEWSEEIREVYDLCVRTKAETNGYFDHISHGSINPLGIVKGWAIKKGSELLLEHGYKNFYIEAGGDIQVHGMNYEGTPWITGIRNPFNRLENVKLLSLTNCGIATSGSYIRGNHIYDPYNRNMPISDIVSMSVIGPDVLEADRFATATFAMGKEGILFVEKTKGLEGYMIDRHGTATYTSGFEKYVNLQKSNNSFNYTFL